MKVVVVNKPGYPIPYIGGIERYSLEMAKHLAKKEIDVVLVSSLFWNRRSINFDRLLIVNARLPLHRIAREGSIIWLLHHLLGSIAYALSAFKQSINTHTNVVHVNDGLTALLMSMLRRLTKQRYALIVSIHAPPPWEMSYGKHYLLMKIVYILVYIAGMFNADKIIGVNPIICKSINKVRSKCIFIPNALSKNLIKRGEKPILDKANKITKSYNVNKDYYLFVGRLVPEKGIDDLIRIFAKYKHKYKGRYELVIVGRGPLEKYVKRVSKVLKDIRYLGYLPREHLEAFYIKARALLLTSRVEGLPTVALESLAYGTPVIMKAIKGVKEILTSIAPNHVVLYEDEEEAATILKKFEKSRNTMAGKNNIMLDKITWDGIVEKIIEVYNSIIKE